jgi:hypothetical protein
MEGNYALYAMRVLMRELVMVVELVEVESKQNS